MNLLAANIRAPFGARVVLVIPHELAPQSFKLASPPEGRSRAEGAETCLDLSQQAAEALHAAHRARSNDIRQLVQA